MEAAVKLDVGCGTKKCDGYIGIDRVDDPRVDINHELSVLPWPIGEDTVDEIRMIQVIEHLPDIVGTMEEIHRILKPGGRAVIAYPWYRSYGAYSDPTHVHFLNDRMIDYFTDSPYGMRYGYSAKKFTLHRRELVTYPVLAFLPDRLLKFVNRHLGLDIIHGVEIEIEPIKDR
jgi:SAM-dependent methyltransferase